jgi:adenine phosphoribosyltransferase
VDDITKKSVLRAFAWVDGHSNLWPILADASLFRAVIDSLSAPFVDRRITKVVGIEAKGFVLGGAVARQLNAGFVAIRKPGGLFPGPKFEATTDQDYRGNRTVLQLQKASLNPEDLVILVDDWFEKGSQALAARKLILETGASYVGASIIVDQLDNEKRTKLGELHSIVMATELGDGT